MKRITTLIVYIAFFVGCESEKTAEIKIDEAALLRNLQVLSHDSLEGRGFATEGNYKAQKFIVSKFEEIGVQSAFESGFIQEFPHTLKKGTRQMLFPVPFAESDYSNVPDTTVTGGNVVAIIPGESEKTIVVTGHLDHLGIRGGEIYNGADDDASGTVALLAIAEYFNIQTPKHTLVLAAVDAEEIGSPGCAYLLDNFPGGRENIILNVNMDMIAHNDSSEIYACGLYHYPQLKPPLESIDSPIKLLYGHDDPNNEDMDDWTESSDHRIFHEANIPFIYFGVEDHKDYHEPSDTFENINQQFYIDAVKLVIQAIEGYDESMD